MVSKYTRCYSCMSTHLCRLYHPCVPLPTCPSCRPVQGVGSSTIPSHKSVNCGWSEEWITYIMATIAFDWYRHKRGGSGGRLQTMRIVEESRTLQYVTHRAQVGCWVSTYSVLCEMVNGHLLRASISRLPVASSLAPSCMPTRPLLLTITPCLSDVPYPATTEERGGFFHWLLYCHNSKTSSAPHWVGHSR